MDIIDLESDYSDMSEPGYDPDCADSEDDDDVIIVEPPVVKREPIKEPGAPDSPLPSVKKEADVGKRKRDTADAVGDKVAKVGKAGDSPMLGVAPAPPVPLSLVPSRAPLPPPPLPPRSPNKSFSKYDVLSLAMMAYFQKRGDPMPPLASSSPSPPSFSLFSGGGGGGGGFSSSSSSNYGGGGGVAKQRKLQPKAKVQAKAKAKAKVSGEALCNLGQAANIQALVHTNIEALKKAVKPIHLADDLIFAHYRQYIPNVKQRVQFMCRFIRSELAKIVIAELANVGVVCPDAEEFNAVYNRTISVGKREIKRIGHFMTNPKNKNLVSHIGHVLLRMPNAWFKAKDEEAIKKVIYADTLCKMGVRSESDQYKIYTQYLQPHVQEEMRLYIWV